jgi:predicted ABC-type ATPase
VPSFQGTLLVVTGPPGAGKSSVAELVVDRFPKSVLVSGDAFFGFLRRDAIPPWLAEAHEQNEVVVAASAVATGRFVAGFTTVFDGMVGPWFLPTFMEAAGVEQLHYSVLLPTVDRCVERIAARDGHGFDDEGATRHMYRTFVNAAIDDRHVIRNEADAPSVTADEILRRFDGGELMYPAVPR